MLIFIIMVFFLVDDMEYDGIGDEIEKIFFFYDVRNDIFGK